MWKVSTSAFATWADGDIANYSIAMTPIGRKHFADFPALITTAGTYDVFVCLQATGTPAITDSFISQGQICWDGTAEIVLSTIDTNVDSLITARGIIQNTTVQTETDIEKTKARIYL